MPERMLSLADYQVDMEFDFTTGATTAYDLLVDTSVSPELDDYSARSFAEREEDFYVRTAPAKSESAYRSGTELKDLMLARIAIRRSTEHQPLPVHLSPVQEDVLGPTHLKPVPSPYIGVVPRPTFRRPKKSEPGYMLEDYMDDEWGGESPVRGYVSREDFPGLYRLPKTIAPAVEAARQERALPASPDAGLVLRVPAETTPAYLRWTTSPVGHSESHGTLRSASLTLLAEMARDAVERAVVTAPELPIPALAHTPANPYRPYENPFAGLIEDDEPASPIVDAEPEPATDAAPVAQVFATSPQETQVDAQRNELLQECNESLSPVTLSVEEALPEPMGEEARRKRMAFFHRVLRGLRNL